MADENRYGGLLGLTDSDLLARAMALQQRRGLLDGLQLTGEGGSINERGVSGGYMGGRVGYEMPLDQNSALTFGATGGGARVAIDTPMGTIKRNPLMLNALDAAYRNGRDQYSVELGLNPVKQLMLRYRTSF